ncbi:MAG: lysylphosphatidylglycerol synthase transmembrane domain-containing protein [Spirochaetes bacterium]|nr:lysylphosphatidylglycerol synthase transmembrane domain-containing protein [Spirochaetota bacterium]
MDIETREELLSERKRRIFSLRSLVLVCLSVLVLYFLFRETDFNLLKKLFVSVKYHLLLLALLLYVCSNLLKAVRLRIILRDSTTRAVNYFIITGFHNFFNQILPARTGELTLIYYLNRYANVSKAQGLYSLLVVRIIDLVVVAVYFLVSFILFFWGRVTLSLALFAIAAVFFSVFILFMLPFCARIARKLFHWVFRPSSESSVLIRKVGHYFDSVYEGFTSASVDGALFLRLVAISILIWGALYSLFYVSIVAFGIEISYIQSIAGSTGAVLTNVLPVNGIGGFGSHEAGWTGGFMMAGLSKELALATAITSHLVIFISSASVALVSVVVRKYAHSESSE